MSKTSSTVTNRHISNTYKKYGILVRLDSELYQLLEQYKKDKSLNKLVVELLESHFSER